MRIAILLLVSVFFLSCQTGSEIPDQYTGRFYGVDSIYRNQKALEIEDTLVNPIYLDVEPQGKGLYDVFNNNGFWAISGLLTQERIAIDISSFKGVIRFYEDSIYLEADSNSELISVSHKTTLSR